MRALSDHTDVDNVICRYKRKVVLLKKINDMSYKSVDEFAEAIVKSGGGKQLILKSLKAVHKQGYESGYQDCTNDIRKAKQAMKTTASKAFKGEMDTIDDVMKGKWL